MDLTDVDDWEGLDPQTREVLEDFSFLYDAYYLEKDENLTENAIKIKRAISDVMTELEETKGQIPFTTQDIELFLKEELEEINKKLSILVGENKTERVKVYRTPLDEYGGGLVFLPTDIEHTNPDELSGWAGIVLAELKREQETDWEYLGEYDIPIELLEKISYGCAYIE